MSKIISKYKRKFWVIVCPECGDEDHLSRLPMRRIAFETGSDVITHLCGACGAEFVGYSPRPATKADISTLG